MSLLAPENPTLYGNPTFGDIPVLAERVKKLRALAAEKRNKHLQVMEDSINTKSPCIPWNKHGANCLYTTLSKFKKTEPSTVAIAGNKQFANEGDKYSYKNQGFEQISLLDALPGDFAQIWDSYNKYPVHMMTLAEKAKDPNLNEYIYANGKAGSLIRKKKYQTNIKAYRYLGKELIENMDKVSLIDRNPHSVSSKISPMPKISFIKQ